MAQASSNGRPKHVTSTDLVVTYDIMREAATRLRGLYAQEIGEGGPTDPAIVKMREIRAEVEAVDPRDIEAQRSMTEKLHREYAAHCA